ncbi:MAG: hypothetical protein K5905_29195 [Roseibium sp.]|uniref:hypothetical protein n=1 Tax=Roseibium sp. TaxID=1936156 RepID=UPI002608A602|nr:hypothetical protein [Roseibium sp.]MCV0429536.1 hypothetical protein [Roseibium sp.]
MTWLGPWGLQTQNALVWTGSGKGRTSIYPMLAPEPKIAPKFSSGLLKANGFQFDQVCCSCSANHNLINICRQQIKATVEKGHILVFLPETQNRLDTNICINAILSTQMIAICIYILCTIASRSTNIRYHTLNQLLFIQKN